MPVIYKITSPTNKIYIGQSWDFISRIGFYKTYKCKNQVKLYNSLLKHSYESHKVEIICSLPEDITQDYLDLYELTYWQFYKDCNFDMLNIRESGRAGRLSEETKVKIRNKLKGRPLDIKHKENVINALYGRRFSEESKKKIGDSNRGVNNGMFGRSGNLNPMSKQVLDLSNNNIFTCVREAAESSGISKQILINKLNGRTKNNTTLIYVSNS